ncbi:hypothetical protein [Botrimarina hoheduenensis]|uniref:hypothetical protein n=1 Tax=Botrimarina hoheduenensis TaxID=2528000 RepID=UPI0011B52ABB|nr:hypothetical protein [Botrimarina hoheduenensis]
MKSKTKTLFAIALMLAFAAVSPLYNMLFHADAFSGNARVAIYVSVALGFLVGIAGIWIWFLLYANDNPTILPRSAERRNAAICGLFTVAVGAFSGFLVLVPIGFTIVALAVAYRVDKKT